ncbi:MAG: hypothetical protein K2K10_08660, partial [Acetatifactor sp.]|nr:hypothetical protein [Acetatifactor sp.]
NMMNYADDFYDNGKYGWNKAYGDGVLLLDNWYEDTDGSQKGSWLSTSGRMEYRIGAEEEGEILDAMYEYIDRNPYKAYWAAVACFAAFEIDENTKDFGGYLENHLEICFIIFIIPLIIALIYARVHLKPSKGSDTTVASTYVKGGVPVLRSSSDSFIRKNVVSYQIRSDNDNSSNSTRRVTNTGGSSFSSSSSMRSSNHSSSSSSHSTGSANRSSVSSNTRGGGSYGHHISGGRRTGSSGSSSSTTRSSDSVRSSSSSVRSGSSSGKSGGSGGGHSHGGGGRRR